MVVQVKVITPLTNVVNLVDLFTHSKEIFQIANHIGHLKLKLIDAQLLFHLY